MVYPKSKLGATSPWRHDGGAVFGRDEPETPWQMEGVGNDVEDEDFDGIDEDARAAGSELRKRGDARDTFKVSAAAKDRAEQIWLGNRELYRGLWNDGVENAEGPPTSAALSKVDDGLDVDDWDLVDKIEVAMTGYIRRNAKYQKRMGFSLKFSDFLEYIQKYASDLIPQLWLIHSRETSVGGRPDDIVVVGRVNSDGSFHSLRVYAASEWDDAQADSDTMVLHFEYRLSTHQYHVVKAVGAGAQKASSTYVAACAVALQSRVEEVFWVKLLGSRLEANRLTWSDVVQYLANNPTFYHRLWNMRQHVNSAIGELPNEFVFTSTDDVGAASSVRLLTISEAMEAKLKPIIAQLYFRKHGGEGYYIWKVRGTSARDLALGWLQGLVGRSLGATEKIMAVTWWKTWCRDEVLEWNDFLSELKQPNKLKEFKAVRQQLAPLGAQRGDLYLIYRKEGSRVSGVSFVTDAEFKRDYAKKIITSTGMVHLREYDGKFEVVANKGSKSDDVAVALKQGIVAAEEENAKSVGDVIFPDAGQMEDEARRFSPQSESFGNLDDQVSKPKPLFTPADVMPVPKLERPADVVALPREGGFQITDPEVVKGFQTPPSDRIPVITGPREETVEEMGAVATVAAMVMGVVAFFYGGATLLRAPLGNPAFGSGGGFLSPRDRGGYDGA